MLNSVCKFLKLKFPSTLATPATPITKIHTSDYQAN